MAALESQVVAAELERVRTKLPALFDYDDTFYREIEKRADVEIVSARDIRAPIELRPGGNPGHFDPDDSDMGLGDGPTFDKALIPVVYLKYAVQYSTKTKWTTDSPKKASVNYARHVMAKSMASFRRFIDTLAVGDGTGVLGTVSAFSSAAGVTTATLASDGHRARLLRFGQTINIYDSTLATNRTAGAEKKISFYDGSANQVKFPDVAGLTIGDKVVAQGLSATPPVSLLGVKYHQSTTGTWLGLARASNPEVKGNEVAAGGVLAIAQARLALNKIGDRVGETDGNGKRKKIQAWMHPAQLAAYEELGQAVTVINKTGAERPGLDLLFNEENMRIAGVPIRTHWAWDRTRIDFLDMGAWGRAELHPVDYYDVQGRRIFELRGSSGGVKTSEIFYLVCAMNIFEDNPASGAFISGLTIPSGY